MQMNLIDNDLLSIQEARILAENAKQAQTRLLTMPQEKLDCAVRAMAKVVAQNAKPWRWNRWMKPITATGRINS